MKYSHLVQGVLIIWPAPRAGKMNQMLHCDWLPEHARWYYLAIQDYPLCPPETFAQKPDIINPL